MQTLAASTLARRARNACRAAACAAVCLATAVGFAADRSSRTADIDPSPPPGAPSKLAASVASGGFSTLASTESDATSFALSLSGRGTALDLDAAVRSPLGETFYDRHWLPQLERKFDRLSYTDVTAVLGLSGMQTRAGDELESLARDRVFEATQRAVENVLLIRTRLQDRWDRIQARDDVVRRIEAEMNGTGGRIRERSYRGFQSLRVSGRHKLPAFTVRYATGPFTTLEFELEMAGSAAVQYRWNGPIAHRVGLEYEDDKERFNLLWRVVF